MAALPRTVPRALWHLYVPKLISVLRRGYRLDDFRHDLIAGLTVAVVALPLAMALAIASGTTPEKGLHTAIVAGFLISLFGGSRVQIGGPTAAFIPVVFVVIERFGYGGLILCTLLAGLMLIAAGLLRLGTLMKYMPQPVVVGFTAGIAVSIFSSQIKDSLGLDIAKLPADFLPRWKTYATHIDSIDITTTMLCVAGIVAILAMRRLRPRWPGFLIVVALSAVLVHLAALPVDTIGSRFGGIPTTLPVFDFPHIPFERTFEMLPASFTIAFLAGVESLLSAVVTDGMIGGRHRSNAELVAQGVEAFQISGPLFFAVANRLDDTLDQFAVRPTLFILSLRRVPLMDASSAQAIRQFLDRADKLGIKVFFSGLQPQLHQVLMSMHVLEHPNLLMLADHFQVAAETARDFLAQLAERTRAT